MVHISTIQSGGSYMKQEHVKDEPIYTIESVTIKEFEKDDGGKLRKFDIGFDDVELHFLCNFTNAATIGAAFSDETDNWIGRKIQLYFDPSVMYAGRRTGGIRVRTGKKVPARKPVPVDEFAGSIDDTF